MENGIKEMKILAVYFLVISISLLVLNQLFITKLVDSKNYISSQLKYFILKTVILSSISYFFCFFSPINSTKFMLSSLTIFIVFHFAEAMIVQKKINMKDSNG